MVQDGPGCRGGLCFVAVLISATWLPAAFPPASLTLGEYSTCHQTLFRTHLQPFFIQQGNFHNRIFIFFDKMSVKSYWLGPRWCFCVRRQFSLQLLQRAPFTLSHFLRTSRICRKILPQRTTQRLTSKVVAQM